MLNDHIFQEIAVKALIKHSSLPTHVIANVAPAVIQAMHEAANLAYDEAAALVEDWDNVDGHVCARNIKAQKID